ncbi:hypothetical protein D3C80_2000530 [compost metagenome]
MRLVRTVLKPDATAPTESGMRSSRGRDSFMREKAQTKRIAPMTPIRMKIQCQLA